MPTLAANSAATFTFRFRPLVGGPLEFTTGVTSDGAETDPSDNGVQETTAVTTVGGTLLVTTTADSGPGSLRQAIRSTRTPTAAIATRSSSTSPARGVPTITLQSTLGFISQPVVIDGTTQPTTARVELNGNGLRRGPRHQRRQLDRPRPGHQPVWLRRDLAGGNGGNVVEGTFIGTDPTGTLARPNSLGGIRVFSSGNRIGGLTAAARNVISGNAAAGIAIQGCDGDRQRGAGQLHRPQRGGYGGAARTRHASAASRSSTGPATTPSAERWRARATSSPATPTPRSQVNGTAAPTTRSRGTSSAPIRPAWPDRQRRHRGRRRQQQRTMIGGAGLPGT